MRVNGLKYLVYAKIGLRFLNICVATGLVILLTSMAFAEHATQLLTIPVDQIVAQSQTTVVATVVHQNRAFAVGFAGNQLFRTAVGDSMQSAFGISHGLLAFSRNNVLYLRDLVSGQERPIVADYPALRGVWAPDGKKLAIIALAPDGPRLLLYVLPGARVNLARAGEVRKDFLRWSDDSSRIYYLSAGPNTELIIHHFADGRHTRQKLGLSVKDWRLLDAIPEEMLDAPGATADGTPFAGGPAALPFATAAQVVRAPEGVIFVPAGGPDRALRGWRAGSQQLLYATAVAGTATLAGVPNNDESAGAIPLTFGQGTWDNAVYDTTGATASASDPEPSCTPAPSNTVWFRFDATYQGWLILNAAGSNYDTTITVFQGSTTPGAEVACNDDFSGAQSYVNFLVESGQSYLIMIGAKGSGGTLDLYWSQGYNEPPAAVSVSPSSATGSPQAFTFTVSDPNGNSDVSWMQVLFNLNLSTSPACYVHIDRYGNQMYLMNDDGTIWLGPLTLGSPGVIGNSQCAISGTGAQLTANAQYVYLQLPVTFSDYVVQRDNIYLRATDFLGLQSGWRTVGTVAPVGAAFPSSVTTPETNLAPAFTLTYTDPAGTADIKWMQALFSGSLTSFQACFVHFDVSANQLYLANDIGTAFLDPATIGSSATLANSQCSISLENSSVVLSGNDRNLILDLTFSTAFASTVNVYLRAYSRSEKDSGWQQMGRYTPSPFPVSVTPSQTVVYTGSVGYLTFLFMDTNGATDMPWVEVQIGACVIHVDVVGKQLWLRNALSGGPVFGPADFGSPSVLTDVTLCNVSPQGSSLTLAGNTLTVVIPFWNTYQLGQPFCTTQGYCFPLTPSSGIGGYINMRAVDYAQHDSGWVNKGYFVSRYPNDPSW